MSLPQKEIEHPLGFEIFGRWRFIASLTTGLGIGLALIPLSGNEVAPAMVAFGALCIAAGTALRAGKAETHVEELRQKLLDERSYHAFVDGAIEGFFRTTREGRYLIVNPALAQIYGYESPGQLKAELTDIAASLYVDPNRRNEFESLMKDRRTVHNFVSQIRRRDGSTIWIVENARAVTDDDDQFLFYEGTVEDITEKRESEEATLRALRETQEAMRQKAAFLAAMSHELKTPLNAVIGFSDVMRQELFGPVGTPRYRGYIDDIHGNGRRLLSMINDILDLSRVEGGLIDLEELELNVPDALETARDAVMEGAKEAAPIRVAVPATLPLLRADPKRLHQILAHLLSNATKFTDVGGRIDMRAKTTADGGISIAIRDTGIGMAPELIQQALEPFKQLDARLERSFEGLGLGLPLANALLRLHSGQLAIVSAPGEGTTVSLNFPPERTVMRVRAPAA